jgi:hypothetical protein
VCLLLCFAEHTPPFTTPASLSALCTAPPTCYVPAGSCGRSCLAAISTAASAGIGTAGASAAQSAAAQAGAGTLIEAGQEAMVVAATGGDMEGVGTGGAGALIGAVAEVMVAVAAETALQSAAHALPRGIRTAAVAVAAIMVVVAAATRLLQHTTRRLQAMVVVMRHRRRTLTRLRSSECACVGAFRCVHSLVSCLCNVSRLDRVHLQRVGCSRYHDRHVTADAYAALTAVAVVGLHALCLSEH